MIRIKGDPAPNKHFTKGVIAELRRVTKVVTKPVTKVTGRPQVHPTGADRQRAYRARKAAKA